MACLKEFVWDRHKSYDFLLGAQDAFPFVTHDLAMSQDGTILYGLDDPTITGGARAIRQLNVSQDCLSDI